MPLITSTYRPPFYLPGGTLQTVIPGRLPRPVVRFERETIDLSDGDFLDLDWYAHNNKRLIIVTHGLEGSSQSQYVADMCLQLDKSTFDLLAWNCRSCSGRMNRLPKLYHHGEIEDIAEVVAHVLSMNQYEEIYLAGFSMGGNISIKFLSENKELAPYIKACGVVSTPCDLQAASNTLDKPKNFLLRTYFLRNIHRKLTNKEEQFPGSFPMERFGEIETWRDFDSMFVAPFVGFTDVEAFYHQASANNFIEDVDIPLFLINAINDPVLTETCHPIEVARSSSNIHLELPKSGGHVYFPQKRKNYAVKRLLRFFAQD